MTTSPLNSSADGALLMDAALKLARRGEGFVEPNPMVGAVIVSQQGEIVGEGWHQAFGGPHAEVHALAAAGERGRGGTLYVTLEPCCHFGKTPPCTQAIIRAGICKVVVATGDPAPHVAGGGIRELRKAGIDVEVGVREADAKELIAPFVKMVTKQRPWVIAKWAMTLDGKLATHDGHSKWISNAEARAEVHRLRGRVDAIVTGIGTAAADNPMLTSRPARTTHCFAGGARFFRAARPSFTVGADGRTGARARRHFVSSDRREPKGA